VDVNILLTICVIELAGVPMLAVSSKVSVLLQLPVANVFQLREVAPGRIAVGI
jgi:hypothetical protein